MIIHQASANVGVNYSSGKCYYKRYLENPDHSIHVPYSGWYYTQEQKNKFISYIVNGKMDITAASRKAKMGVHTGLKYYHKYFNDEHPDIPTPSHIVTPKHYSQEQIKEVISYIVDDKMSISAASRKRNISAKNVGKYYRQYLKDYNMELPVSKYHKQYTQDEINRLI